MKNCEQTAGQSVLDHGLSVWEYTQRLINKDLDGLRIPSWFDDSVLNNLHSLETIKQYTIYHDCGKPYCKTIDENGKSHFPNHAEVSRAKWLEVSEDTIVANLINWDMAIHTLSAEQLDKLFGVWSKQDAFTLLIVSLAEVHSNARLFGGIESTSFKSKWKTIERRGKQICKYYLAPIA